MSSVKRNSDKNMLGKLGFKQGKDKEDKYKKKLDDDTYRSSNYYRTKMIREIN